MSLGQDLLATAVVLSNVQGGSKLDDELDVADFFSKSGGSPVKWKCDGALAKKTAALLAGADSGKTSAKQNKPSEPSKPFKASNPPRDKALESRVGFNLPYVKVLSHGVLTYTRTLDGIVDAMVKRDFPPSERILKRNFLKSAIFALLYSEKKEHAIINEGVETAKRLDKGFAPLVNGVLRRIQRWASGKEEIGGLEDLREVVFSRMALAQAAPASLAMRVADGAFDAGMPRGKGMEGLCAQKGEDPSKNPDARPLQRDLLDKILETLAKAGKLPSASSPSGEPKSPTGEEAGKAPLPKFEDFLKSAPAFFDIATENLPKQIRPMAEAIEKRANLPFWWCARLLRSQGLEGANAILEAWCRVPPLTIRINRRKFSKGEGLREFLAGLGDGSVTMESIEPPSNHREGEPALPFGGFSLDLNKVPGISGIPGLDDGLVSVQDRGAQLAARILAPVDGERVLDACSAPGGKSAHILELADVDLVSVDVSPKRLDKVAENFARLGLKGELVAADAAKLGMMFPPMSFDAILADVPCTASGVVKRHPEMRFNRRPGDPGKIAEEQLAIIDALWGLLKNGGRMLYATCSLFEEENSSNVSRFLQSHSDGKLVMELPVMPNEEQDGFYYALIEKAGK